MPMGQSAFVDSPHAPLVVAASVSGRQQQKGGHGVLSVATETRHCDLRRSRINQRLLPAQAAVKRVTPLHSPHSTPLIPLIPSLLTLFGAQLCIFFTPSLARSLATTRAYFARIFRSHIPLAQSARAGVRTAFDTLHQTMKVKEEKIEQLLVQIESRVIDRFKDTVVAGTANRNNWVLPFIFMVLFLGGLTAMACMKYRHMAKSHLF